MRVWTERVIEEAYLFNPAFGATLIAEAVDDYRDKAKRPLPFAVAFLVLPNCPTRGAHAKHCLNRRSLPFCLGLRTIGEPCRLCRTGSTTSGRHP